jgi:dTDP-4-amino-4,6-dideoxygalactose transaminase
MPMRVPFNLPALVGHEVDYVLEAVRNMHISGDGAFTRKCQGLLERELGVRRALLTTSCTDALEMAALLLQVQEGDEVIVPAFAFVSTVNAFVMRGATPRFADIRADTLNLDETVLESLISEHTRAIVVVHYAGVGCEMDAILSIASRYRLAVVEDNAHGLFAQYKGRFLGTFGELATQSFHETKNFTCGEGGALLINDAQYSDRADVLRDKGTNRKRFFEGEVDKYTWVDIGSSFLPSDMLAAFLYAQLERKDEIQQHRRSAWEFYRDSLTSWAAEQGVSLPFVPSYCEHPSHLFYLVLPSSDDRLMMMDHMKDRGISVVFHYQPLHLSEMGRKLGGQRGQCPVTERVADCLIRLPLFHGITKQQQEAVVSAILEYRCCGARRTAARV